MERLSVPFDAYFDRKARRFAGFYRRESVARFLGRGALFDRLEAAVDRATELGARRVLDVGCGSGPLFEPLASKGVHVTGIEPAEGMAALAQREAARFPGLIEIREIGWEAVAERGSYDLAVALGVFDYVDRAVDLLATMGRAAPVVVASFPAPGLRTGLRKLRYGFRGVAVYGYSAARIGDCAEAAGLTVEELAPLGRAGYVLTARRSADTHDCHTPSRVPSPEIR